MKKLEVSLIALFIALTILPSAVIAQTDPPSRCCPINRATPGNLGVDGNAPVLMGSVTISDAELAFQGITRSQFINQISESLFAGEAVDLVLSSVDWILEPSADAQIILIGEEAYYFTVPRLAVTSEDLDTLNQVGLTNGIVYVMINFSSGSL
jgi:hypothetical protein